MIGAKKYYEVKDFVKETGLSRIAIYYYIKMGFLKPTKIVQRPKSIRYLWNEEDFQRDLEKIF